MLPSFELVLVELSGAIGEQALGQEVGNFGADPQRRAGLGGVVVGERVRGSGSIMGRR
jgi:hypothetical protein